MSWNDRRSRICAAKTRYESKAQAEDAVRRAKAKWQREMRYYDCGLCGGYHVELVIRRDVG